MFKFKIEAKEGSEIENSNINNFNNQQIALISFQHRLFNKLLTFIKLDKERGNSAYFTER